MKQFDKVYKQYDKFMDFFNLYKTEEIKNALKLNGHEIIVDIGGGTGHIANYLSDKCKKIYVLDESEKMLSKVEVNKKIVPILGNALNTNFNDYSIDIVILSDVLHHLEDQQSLIKEIHRILNKKGKILILDFDKEHIKTKLIRFFEFFLFGRLYFKSKDEVKKILKDKFSIEEFIDKKHYFIIVGEKI